MPPFCLAMGTIPAGFWVLVLILGAGALFTWLGRRPKPPVPPREKRIPAPDEAPAVDEQSRRPAKLLRPGVFSEEIVPGALSVAVHTHTMTSPAGPVACWTYVSDGLWAHGQKEIVFTVERRSGEEDNAYPTDLLRLYAILHGLAVKGRLVDVGDFTVLRPGIALLGRGGFEGILYTPPQILPGVRLTAPSLTALILTAGEAAVGREQGCVRVMGTLAKRYRYFPTAPWADRDREELLSPEPMKASLVAQMSRAMLLSASVRQESRAVTRKAIPGPVGLTDQTVTLDQGRIVLRLRPGSETTLREMTTALPADAPVALLVGPDPSATACFTWEPAQKEPFAVSDGRTSAVRIAGSFLAFVPGQDEDVGRLLEDGFAMLLRDETWLRVREALESGQPISVPVSGERDLGLDVVWVPALDPDYVDPVESQVPGGFAAFGDPAAVPLGYAGAMHVKSITLLTIEDVIGRRIETAKLGDYIKALEAAALAHLTEATAGAGQDLVIECELSTGGGRTFTLAVRPDSTVDPTGGLKDRLMEVPAPEVPLGPVRFQLNCQLWGGSRRAASSQPS